MCLVDMPNQTKRLKWVVKIFSGCKLEFFSFGIFFMIFFSSKERNSVTPPPNTLLTWAVGRAPSATHGAVH